MSNTIRIRRSTGSAAPSTLQNAELAYSEGVAGGGTLYIGVGTGGSGGSATQVVAIAGPSTYATKSYVDSAVAAVDVSSQLASYVTSTSAAATYAPLASPALTGTPTAPTATAGTNTTQIATTAFVSSAVSSLVNSAPEALNTLKELEIGRAHV